MTKKSQNRNRLINFLAIIALLFLAIALGILCWNNFNKSGSKFNTEHNSSNTQGEYTKPQGWLTYIDSDIPFIFDHPSTWSFEKKRTEIPNSPQEIGNPNVIITLTGLEKTDKSKKVVIVYDKDSRIQDGVGACGGKPKPECVLTTNAISSGYVYTDKRGAVYWTGGEIKDGHNEEINARSFTDLGTFKDIIESIRGN